jgi:hypothetical protein
MGCYSLVNSPQHAVKTVETVSDKFHIANTRLKPGANEMDALSLRPAVRIFMFA